MTPRLRFPSRTLVLRSIVGAVACALLALTAACGGGGSSSPSAAVPSPVLSPVPSGTVIDFARAARMYHDGDYDGALTIYSAAAVSGTLEQKQTGLWEIAKIQFRRGQHSDAEATARAFRATNPSPDLDRQALLLLGSVQLAQGELDAAKESFVAYVATNGPALAYAQLYLAQIDLGQGKPEQAIPRLDAAIAAGLPPHMNYTALSNRAQADEQKQDHAAGAADYRRAADAAQTATDGAEALWYLADAAKAGGDAKTTSDALGELIRAYPRTQRAADAVADPRLQASAVSPLDKALLLFHQQKNDEATAALKPIADAGGPDAPAAQYYLGILSERVEDWNAAIDHYDAAIKALASGSDDKLRAQAYWDIGTVFERVGQTFDAIDNYAKVAEIQPTHAEAAEGLFRAGFLGYNLGRYDDALAHWQRLTVIAQKTGDKARANYWLATVSDAAGDPGSAATYRAAAVTADPLDYYGMRAQAVTSGVTTLPAASTIPAVTPNWSRVETWLRSWAGAEPASPSATSSSSPSPDAAYARGVELFNAGSTDLADAQFTVLLSDNATHPWVEYRLLRQISALDRPAVTAPAAEALVAFHSGAPPELLQLAFPLEYSELAQQEASTNGFSPLLLLALVRQESTYDPGAIAGADDTGLTQVIPATAQEIAQQLGDTGFKQSDLLHPNVALRYGAHYLGSALTSFDGVLSPAIAGYNAGPGTAGGWWDAAGADPDVFLETIEFEGTQTYVKHVLQYYALYLYAYGVTAEPTLPLG